MRCAIVCGVRPQRQGARRLRRIPFLSLLPMAVSHPEPPPQPPAVAGADEDSSDELSLNLDDIEEDE